MRTSSAFHVIFATLAFAAISASAVAVERDCVHLDRQFQTIDHFGASGAWTGEFTGRWSDPVRSHVADLLFSPDTGIGLTMWRFNIGAGVNRQRISAYWNTVDTFETAEGEYDWTRQEGQRWWIAAARARGVSRIMAFANSPPARLTRNGFTNCDNDGSTTNLKPGAEPQYARYLADIANHFRNNPDASQRVTFARLAPFNEPEWDWNSHEQEGNRASNDDIRRLLISLHEELERRKIPVPIEAPESGYLADMMALSHGNTKTYHTLYGYYLDLLAQPQLTPVLDHLVGYHSYWSQTPDTGLYKIRQAFHTGISARFPDFSAWQTECCLMEPHRDLTMNCALRVARIIDADLTVADAAGWSWWLAISNHDYKDGLLYTDWQKTGDGENVIPSRLFWVLGNYSKFVRPGFRRVAIDSDAHGHQTWCGSAFLDAASGRLTIVYLNWGDAPVTIQLQVAKGDAALGNLSLTPNITSDAPGEELKPGPRVSTDRPITIPARSVVTLCGSIP